MNTGLGWLLKDGRKRTVLQHHSCRVGFSAFQKPAIQPPLRPKNKDQSSHGPVWEVARDAWLGFPSGKPSLRPKTCFTANRCTKQAAPTPPRFWKPSGAAPGARGSRHRRQSLTRTGVIAVHACPALGFCDEMTGDNQVKACEG